MVASSLRTCAIKGLSVSSLLFGPFQKLKRQLAADRWKVVEKFVQRLATCQVVNQRSDRHTGTMKNGRTAEYLI